MKRTVGNIRRNRELLEKELAVYTATYEKQATDHRKFDVLEGFAGGARITEAWRNLGLRAMAPPDSIYGWYLDTADGMRSWNTAIDTGCPLAIVVGFPCSCVFNRNVNYRNRREELEDKRKENQHMLKNVITSLHRQADAGRFFLFENPLTGGICPSAEVAGRIQRDDVSTVIGHLCQYSEPLSDGRNRCDGRATAASGS